jgi:hypothetical protein
MQPCTQTLNPKPMLKRGGGADDGMTPAGFASQVGMHQLNITMAKLATVLRVPRVPSEKMTRTVPVETCFCGEIPDESDVGSGLGPPARVICFHRLSFWHNTVLPVFLPLFFTHVHAYAHTRSRTRVDLVVQSSGMLLGDVKSINLNACF